MNNCQVIPRHYYNQMCIVCGGLIAEPNKAYGYAGPMCHCAHPQISTMQGIGQGGLGGIGQQGLLGQQFILKEPIQQLQEQITKLNEALFGPNQIITADDIQFLKQARLNAERKRNGNTENKRRKRTTKRNRKK